MEENRQIFSNKVGLNKNLVVPIVIVVLLTGLAVWLVPDDAEQDVKKPLPKLGSVIRPLDSDASPDKVPAADEIITQDRDTDADSRSDGGISQSVVKDQKDARSTIAQLRQEGGNTGQKAFEAAERQRKNGNNGDAYILHFYAAKQGHGGAAYVLGTQYDPNYFTSANSALDAPDPGQAIKWYRIAINAGINDARQRLAELAKRIQQQAEAGSDQAQRLMLQLQ